MKQALSLLCCIVFFLASTYSQDTIDSDMFGLSRPEFSDAESYHKWVTTYNNYNTAVKSRNAKTHKLDSVFYFFNSSVSPIQLELKFRVESVYSDSLHSNIVSDCIDDLCIRSRFGLVHLDDQGRIVELSGHFGWDDSDEVYSNHPAVEQDFYTYNSLGLVDTISSWTTLNPIEYNILTVHYYNEYNLLDSLRRTTVDTKADTVRATQGLYYYYDDHQNMILYRSTHGTGNEARTGISSVGYDHDDQGRIISRQIGATLDTANSRIYYESTYTYEEELLSEIKIQRYGSSGEPYPYYIQEIHDRYYNNDPRRIQGKIIQDSLYFGLDNHDYWYQFNTSVSKSDILFTPTLISRFSEWTSMIRMEQGLNYKQVQVSNDDNFNDFRFEYHYSKVGTSKTTDIPEIAASLYPNPADHAVSIQATDLSGRLLLELYDATGRLIKSQSVVVNQTIDVSELDSGIYVYKIEAAGGSATGKLVVE